MNSPAETNGPLRGIRVLDMSRMSPGAFCTLLLADLGADVVKIEAPGIGDGLRRMARAGQFNASHTALNRGKRSMVLDLRNAGAPPILDRLMASTDVVVESHRPGQLDKLGFGYDAMSGRYPRIVWCSITGFGDFGPNASFPGHDLTYLGYSGLLGRLTDAPATPPGTALSLPLAASLAAVGILAALTETKTTGRGRRLDVNMADSAMWVLSEDVTRAANGPGRGWGASASRNVYTCADGRQVTVAANEPRTWATLCEALGATELAAHRLGVDDDAPVRARLAELFLSRPASHWTADPGLSGGVGPVNEAADLLDDPQVTERGSLVELRGSKVRVLANPIRYASAAGEQASSALSPAPDLGFHTDEVLAGAGYGAAEIEALRAAEIVG